ncbi:hypothetical protein BH23BAC3_BH23BAC3_36530 [soil metagenome]
MTPNTSLQLSYEFKKRLKHFSLQSLSDRIPSDVIDQYYQREKITTRTRVFSPEATICCMVGAAMMEDKSQKNVLFQYKQAFEHQAGQLVEEQTQALESPKKSRGPRRTRLNLPKSMTTPVSENTAGFSKAVKRIPRDLMRELFDHSARAGDCQPLTWHGYGVYLGDGTYFQAQDTPSLSDVYPKESPQSYPRGALMAISQESTGLIHNFAVGSSELETARRAIERLPSGSLFIGDELYNCYGFWSDLSSRDVEFIVPVKRKRTCEFAEELGPGDALVRIRRPAPSKTSLWADLYDQLPREMTLRRITYTNPGSAGSQRVLITSLTDPAIPATDIVAKYTSRWDIELRIREIKTVMGIHIARSKTPDGVYKEIAAALIAYNITRELITESVHPDFSPSENIFQEYCTGREEPLTDKTGRVYHRRSPGRPAEAEGTN